MPDIQGSHADKMKALGAVLFMVVALAVVFVLFHFINKGAPPPPVKPV